MLFPTTAYQSRAFLRYWFGTLDNCWRPMEQQAFDLSWLMISYLTNFSKTGNPNKPAHMGCPSMLRLVKAMLYNKAVGE